MIEGLITHRSHHTPKATADRLAARITAHGATVMARIDHAAAAAKVGLEMRPTEVLIFGNPNVGTHLMLDTQVMGLELPSKVLVWQDPDGRTCLSYEDMEWLARRFGITSSAWPAVEKLSSLTKRIVEEAAAEAS